MHRIAGLEPDDCIPAAPFELRARLRRRQARRIAVARQNPNGAADEHALSLVERRHAGMLFFFGSVDVARLTRFIVLENVLDLDHTPHLALTVVERSAAAGRRRFLAVDRQY